MKKWNCFILILLLCKGAFSQNLKGFIPWEIILPESFIEINDQLNENRNLYSKNKVSRVTQIIKIINDTSILYINHKGLIYKVYRGLNNESKQKAIRKYKKTRNHVTETTIEFGLKEYIYDKNGKINKVIYSQFNDSAQVKKCYTYQLYYNKDSVIRSVDIFDSTDAFFGRVSLQYKNNFVTKEIGYLKKRKVYTKKHRYTFNKYNGEILDESITFNKVLISESIFWKNKRIILKKFSDYSYSEQVNLDIEIDCKLSLYKQTNYSNLGSIPNLIESKLLGYNIDNQLKYSCKLADVNSLYSKNKNFPMCVENYKYEYNEKGLLEKTFFKANQNVNEEISLELIYDYYE